MDKPDIEIIEGSWEWDVPACDESHVPNKYRSKLETDDAGIVKVTDMITAVNFGLI